jgi:hypothetical protein
VKGYRKRRDEEAQAKSGQAQGKRKGAH